MFVMQVFPLLMAAASATYLSYSAPVAVTAPAAVGYYAPYSRPAIAYTAPAAVATSYSNTYRYPAPRLAVSTVAPVAYAATAVAATPLAVGSYGGAYGYGAAPYGYSAHA